MDTRSIQASPRHAARRAGRPRAAAPITAALLDPYLLTGAAIVLWAVGVVAAGTWVGDFQLHVATVRTLAGDFTHPVDPMVGTGHGSPYYSPYTLLLAAIVRALGADPSTLLAAFGVVNVIVLLTAFRRLVARFSHSSLAAAIALAALLLLWGPASPGWSGFPDLRSLADTAPYPSTMALALLLFLWERLLRYRTEPTLAGAAVIGALAATTVLVHPFTAIEAAIGGTAILAGATRQLPARGWRWLVGAGALATLAVAAWPYSSLADLFTTGASLVDVHRPLRAALLDGGSLCCVYGAVALPALALRLRRDRLDPLVLTFALGAAVVAAALLSRQHEYLRATPAMMLPLQVAFGIFVAERSCARTWVRLVTAAAAVAAVTSGLAVNPSPELGAASGLPLSWLPRSLARELRTPPAGADPVDRVRGFAPAGSIILADTRRADQRLNLLGYYSVNPGWPNPWIGDERARATDRRILRTATVPPAVRGDIARRYGARCVLVTATPAVTAVGGYLRVDGWLGGALFCR